MKQATVGFAVYGVHKDGLLDPMGAPFIDEALVADSKKALRAAGLRLVEHPVVVASKSEARACFDAFRKRDDVSAVILFSGTWVWAAHLMSAIQEYARTGRGLVVWTHPGSQGWRPVGGLVLHGGLKELGLEHRFVYGAHDETEAIERIASYARAASEKQSLNHGTVGAFGGRGMGQTCGVADPSQWMKTFGLDIDSRDTTDLIREADAVTASELTAARRAIEPLFQAAIPRGPVADRSIRLYLAIKKIMARERWLFYTIQSFPGLGDDYSATCFAQSMMLNEGVGTSTLCDFNTALTVKLLTDMGDERVYYGDLQHIDKARREIKIIGDGACPPSLACGWGPAGFAEHGIPTEGKAGGLSVNLLCKPGEGVLARLGRTDGRLELVFCRCTVSAPPPDETERRRRECGIPFWPHAFVTAHADMDRLLESWNNEYACLGYGRHLYGELQSFCDLTGIRAVAL